MGILTAIQGNRVYLDANIWIYALEAHPNFSTALAELFQAIDQGGLTAVTSELSLAETLVKPMLDQKVPRQIEYRQAISSRQYLRVIPIQRSLLIEAARLRATSNLKLPDAIHVATALTTQCTTFLTNDQGLRSITEMPIVILSQSISP
ncbi:PilT protein domain protein (plasmid) [Leptolyngbya sp. NIES-3755]|nr:PilT protein domain protein [Leptolyngbya sp. NIES-3755]